MRLVFGVIEKLLDIAREALVARGEQQRVDELEQEVVALRRELNELKSYRDRVEVAEEALRILRTQQG